MDKTTSESTTNINTKQSYPYLYKGSDTDKCSPTKKCPCRMWCNCPQYIDIIQQKIRLKLKSIEKSEIEEWYKTYFRLVDEFHNLYSTGW